jgi:hypothetical protein
LSLLSLLVSSSSPQPLRSYFERSPSSC